MLDSLSEYELKLRESSQNRALIQRDFPTRSQLGDEEARAPDRLVLHTRTELSEAGGHPRYMIVAPAHAASVTADAYQHLDVGYLPGSSKRIEASAPAMSNQSIQQSAPQTSSILTTEPFAGHDAERQSYEDMCHYLEAHAEGPPVNSPGSVRKNAE